MPHRTTEKISDSLGDVPDAKMIEPEVERARELCSGTNPLPVWLRAQAMARNAAGGKDPGSLQQAIADNGVLMSEFPDSPLGYAGMGELLLVRAEVAELQSSMPFQVREWREQAEGLLLLARSKSSDWGLVVSHARALTSLRDYEQARELLGTVPNGFARSLDVRLAQVQLFEQSGDYQAVVDLLDLEPPIFGRGERLYGGGTVTEPITEWQPGYGSFEARPVELFDPTQQLGGGGNVVDHSFVPRSRYSEAASGKCLEQSGVNARVLLGRNEEALNWSPKFSTPDFAPPQPDGSVDESPCHYAWWADPGLYDFRLDLFRWAGDFTEAARLADDWIDAEGTSATHQARGEIAFLTADWDTAVHQFEQALEAPGLADLNTEFSGWEPWSLVKMQLAAARAARGDDQAQRLLEELLVELEQNAEFGPAVEPSFYAESELGTFHLRQKRYSEAVEHLQNAVDLGFEKDSERSSAMRLTSEGLPENALLKGGQENNLALALALTGDHVKSVEMAERALAKDPVSPIYWDTLAFAHHQAGNTNAAADAYIEALDEDETSSASANNLGVLLGEAGDHRQAQRMFTQALGADPDYALARHNLAVAKAQTVGADAILVEANFGHAGRLDRSYRGHAARYVVDDTIYSTELDISKPLSPEWTYASSASDPKSRFGLMMIVLLGVRLAASLGLDKLVDQVLIDRRRKRLSSSRWATLAAVVGMVVSVGALAWPGIVWAPTRVEQVVIGLGMGALVLLPLAVRKIVTPHGMGSSHEGWWPAILAGAAMVPLGVTFAPYPGLHSSSAGVPRRTQWAPVVTAATITIIFVTAAFLTAVPVARVMAMAGAALTASMLLPVPPFDGAKLSSRLIGIASTVILGGLTFVFITQWV